MKNMSGFNCYPSLSGKLLFLLFPQCSALAQHCAIYLNRFAVKLFKQVHKCFLFCTIVIGYVI